MCKNKTNENFQQFKDRVVAFYSGLVIDCDTSMSAMRVGDAGKEENFERTAYLLGLAKAKVLTGFHSG